MPDRADDPIFRFLLERFMMLRAAEVGATEAAAFDVDLQAPTRSRLVLHVRPDQSSPDVRAAAVAAFLELIAPCVVQSTDGAIEVGDPDGKGEPQFCLITLLYVDGSPSLAIGYITRASSDVHAKALLGVLRRGGPGAADEV
ncbi:MAG: hypothetical protein ACAI43_01170 [Phycisphaerae bacterium]|nr:hypothetical protein [Tepidisphaeraceae bacterium]